MSKIMVEQLQCPRCKGIKFKQIDCGPDGYDDDVTWTSDVCENCGLWHSGWTGKWLVDCTWWIEEEDAKEYKRKGVL